jgi:hypothetical protein
VWTQRFAIYFTLTSIYRAVDSSTFKIKVVKNLITSKNASSLMAIKTINDESRLRTTIQTFINSVNTATADICFSILMIVSEDVFRQFPVVASVCANSLGLLSDRRKGTCQYSQCSSKERPERRHYQSRGHGEHYR